MSRQSHETGGQGDVVGRWLTDASLQEPAVCGRSWRPFAPFLGWLVHELRPEVTVALGLDERSLGFLSVVVDAASSDRVGIASSVRSRATAAPETAEPVVLAGRSDHLSSAVLSEASVDLLVVDLDALGTSPQSSWEHLMSNIGTVVIRGGRPPSRYGWIAVQHPTFEFLHRGGLGVVAVGTAVPESVRALVRLDPDGSTSSVVRRVYERLGDVVESDRRYVIAARRLDAADAAYEEVVERAVDLAGAEHRLGQIEHSTMWRTLRPARDAVSRARLRRRALRRESVNPRRDYGQWIGEYDTHSAADVQGMLQIERELARRPTISILMPVHDPPRTELRAAVTALEEQVYAHWELCLVDDSSTAVESIEALSDLERAGDGRIIVRRRDAPGGVAEALDDALDLARGEFCAHLDVHDVLRPHALLLVAHALDAHGRGRIVYTDEDRLTASGMRVDPVFKPAWNRALLEGQNYLSRLTVVETRLARAAGGFGTGPGGHEDWDLALRLARLVDDEDVIHVPFVCCHTRRTAAPSTTDDSAAELLRRHFDRRDIPVSVVRDTAGFRVRHHPIEPLPRVSIVIVTSLRRELIVPTVEEVLRVTDYPLVDLFVVAHEDALAGPDHKDVVTELCSDSRVRLVSHRCKPFNFSEANNVGARASDSELVLFLNDDVRPLEPRWLSAMVGHIQDERVGAVGAHLLYPDGSTQHGGVILSERGPFHACHGLRATAGGYLGRARLAQDLSAVTGACVLVRRAAFDEVGGFDPELAIAYNDVDLCLKLRAHGWRVVYTPLARLMHLTSASLGPHDRGRESEWQAERRLVLSRWSVQMRRDPAVSPNLNVYVRGEEERDLAFPPRVRPPWRSLRVEGPVTSAS